MSLLRGTLFLLFAKKLIDMFRKAGKKFSFFPLKDSYGTTQLVVFSKDLPEILDLMRSVTPESTVLVQGVVNARPESQRRPVSFSSSLPLNDIYFPVSSALHPSRQ